MYTYFCILYVRSFKLSNVFFFFTNQLNYNDFIACKFYTMFWSIIGNKISYLGQVNLTKCFILLLVLASNLSQNNTTTAVGFGIGAIML